ncbi:hypothetical protein J2S13_002741 [Oikeobacillus pervagus]|uniref:Uncharacterized protein n=1 Tax=Oikeobacillus pervagus TaxID=1325931 RepID=A0AAJ1WK28_9BACI|nr:Lmo0850 family protein [Oikeobacillus pervagus]MDQ0216300.1 hypothetical protein [Oikeobacillus pervagus]
MGKDHERVVKVIAKISQLGVKVTKTKSRNEVFHALKGYPRIADYVKS